MNNLEQNCIELLSDLFFNRPSSVNEALLKQDRVKSLEISVPTSALKEERSHSQSQEIRTLESHNSSAVTIPKYLVVKQIQAA